MKTTQVAVFGLSLSLALVLSTAAWGTQITVPDDFSTIQQALDAANSGDIVFVRAGTYHEHLTVAKSLTIQGEDRSGTVIDGDGSGAVIYASADFVTVQHLTVTNGEFGVRLIADYTIDHFTLDDAVITGNSGYGLEAAHNNASSYHAITSCEFSNNGAAIYAHQFGYSEISNCELFGNGSGMVLGWGSYTTISGNDVHGNSGVCIHIDSGNTNTVELNNIHDNTACGLSVGYVGNQNTIRNNIVRNNNSGVCMGGPSVQSNHIYGNQILNNTNQCVDQEGDNFWDNGYPEGGNFWSDYSGQDNYSGPNQDIPGSDGIGDTPYLGSDGTIDHYPLFESTVAVSPTSWATMKRLYR